MPFKTNTYREIEDLEIKVGTLDYYRLNYFITILSGFERSKKKEFLWIGQDYLFALLGQRQALERRLQFLHQNGIIERSGEATKYIKFRYYAYRLTKPLTLMRENIPIESKTLVQSLENYYMNYIKDDTHEYLNVKQLLDNFINGNNINENSTYIKSSIIGMMAENCGKVNWNFNVDEYVANYPNDEWAESRYYGLTRSRHYLEYAYEIKQESLSGRIHTPFTTLPKQLRKKLLINGNKTVQLDLSTTAPNILSKVFQEIPGSHDFSEYFQTHYKDFYNKLNQKLNVYDPKEYVLKMINSPTNSKAHLQFCEMFPDDGKYLQEIKELNLFANQKRWGKGKITGRPYPRFHSNIHFILSAEEVRIFKKIWMLLKAHNIDFITVHDCIIVESHHMQVTLNLMNQVMETEFDNFLIKEE